MYSAKRIAHIIEQLDTKKAARIEQYYCELHHRETQAKFLHRINGTYEARRAKLQARLDLLLAPRLARRLAQDHAAAILEDKRRAKRKAREDKQSAKRKAREDKRNAKRKAHDHAAAILEDKRHAKRKAREDKQNAKRKAREDKQLATRKAHEDKQQAKRKAREDKRSAKRKAREDEQHAARKARSKAKSDAKYHAKVRVRLADLKSSIKNRFGNNYSLARLRYYAEAGKPTTIICKSCGEYIKASRTIISKVVQDYHLVFCERCFGTGYGHRDSTASVEQRVAEREAASAVARVLEKADTDQRVDLDRLRNGLRTRRAVGVCGKRWLLRGVEKEARYEAAKREVQTVHQEVFFRLCVENGRTGWEHARFDDAGSYAVFICSDCQYSYAQKLVAFVCGWKASHDCGNTVECPRVMHSTYHQAVIDAALERTRGAKP